MKPIRNKDTDVEKKLAKSKMTKCVSIFNYSFSFYFNFFIFQLFSIILLASYYLIEQNRKIANLKIIKTYRFKTHKKLASLLFYSH